MFTENETKAIVQDYSASIKGFYTLKASGKKAFEKSLKKKEEI